MKRLTKSSTDKMLSGVCSGIADFFDISPFIVRLLFIFIPFSLVVYFVLTILLPEGPNYLRK